MMSASWIIPSLVGPPVSGVAAEVWSWRTVFDGLAVLTALPAIALVVALRRAHGGSGDPDLPDGLPPAGERASRPPLVVAGMLDPCVTVLPLSRSAPDRLGHATSASRPP